MLFYVIYRKFLLINETFHGSRNFPHYKQLVIIHNRLCDLCYDVNSLFDQQILILITSHFTYIICNIYIVVVIFIEATQGHVLISKHLNFIFLIVYTCVFKSVDLVWIVYFATMTQDEVRIGSLFPSLVPVAQSY
uniref:Uncharacterized protein n=1 Tax=Cacopsylla melanoneura TaxID=428564 RepID=A0A8D8R2F0_9HEMI